MLSIIKKTETSYECRLDLLKLFDGKSLVEFNKRYEEFLLSDPYNSEILNRRKDIIIYPHKSWIPKTSDNRMNLLILGGNPASHSAFKDIYFSYEGNGLEHRFWKVFRSLGYWDIDGKNPNLKNIFLHVDYASDFRIGLEAMFTFPSTASKPKWSGVAGLEKLFGKVAFGKIYEYEKLRVKNVINSFFNDQPGAILVMQKHAYNAISENKYDLKAASLGGLKSNYSDEIRIYGTPPTRWLYTKKMQDVLNEIKKEALLPLYPFPYNEVI
jgi:hypothetical protein